MVVERKMPPVVDEEKCTGCGTCVDVCPSEVFALEGGKSKVVNPDDCVECEACVQNTWTRVSTYAKLPRRRNHTRVTPLDTMTESGLTLGFPSLLFQLTF